MFKYQKFPHIDPKRIQARVSNQCGAIFLDSSYVDEKIGRFSFIALNPLQIFDQGSLIDQIPKFEQILSSNQSEIPSDFPPFIGGLLGYISYDVCRDLESITKNKPEQIPSFYLGLYNQVIAFDHINQECYIIVSKVKGFDLDYAEQFNQLINLYHGAVDAKSDSVNFATLPKLEIQAGVTQNQYLTMVNQAKEYILNGEVYEINLSQPFMAELPPNYPSTTLYKRLCEINSAPFSAYLNLGDLKILSASPERFLSYRNNRLQARPIKGTIKRSSNNMEDQKLKEILSKSTKDIAENVMIVDLMRNDFSKVCEAESVKVSQLCRIESYPNLHHLVSTIEGSLKSNLFDAFLACFPGGSITGAPKVRSIELIEKLEQFPRGVYCGNIGYFSFSGAMDFSIAIRTITIKDLSLIYNVGGAVTLDSEANAEYQETLIKGQKISEAINGITT